MSVVIKDMDMPDSCAKCRLHYTKFGLDYCAALSHDRYLYSVTCSVESNTRSEKCNLLENTKEVTK